jgi:hypothetical protein
LMALLLNDGVRSEPEPIAAGIGGPTPAR